MGYICQFVVLIHMARQNINQSVEPRISSLETSVRGIETRIDHLSNMVQKVADGIASSAKTNWGTLLSAIGISIVMITGIGSSYILPLNTEMRLNAVHNDSIRKIYVDNYNREIDLLKGLSFKDGEKISAISKELETLKGEVQRNDARIMEKLKEIETQFAWLNDVTNIRNRSIDRNISILWNDIFKTEMPQSSASDAGPSK